MTASKHNTNITTWLQFNELRRSTKFRLLKRLEEFPNSVLVTGCQRSGTTMLTEIITQSQGMFDYQFGEDISLDSALILSGCVIHQRQGRYCFQTTHLDERYNEYFEQQGEFKIIWSIRNPLSVICSMLYNWSEYALNVTFQRCGAPLLTGLQKSLYKIFSIHGISKLRQACLTYIGRISEIFVMQPKLGSEKIMILDYDDLVEHKEQILSKIYSFIDLNYKKEYSDKIKASSLNKASRLSGYEITTIKALCEPIYKEVRTLLPRF